VEVWREQLELEEVVDLAEDHRDELERREVESRVWPEHEVDWDGNGWCHQDQEWGMKELMEEWEKSWG
jgi:hypothetical protein